MTDPVPPEGQMPAQEPTWFGAAIDKHISDALGRLFDSGKATVTDTSEPQQQRGNPAKPAGPDVEGQTRDAQDLVEQAVKRIEQRTTEDQARLAHDEEHKRIASLVEKIPEAERKVERRMGWRI